MNFSTLSTILVTFCPETSEFTLLTIAPFATIRQKLAYHVQYLRISWTCLDTLNRFVRRIGGDDYSNVCLAVAQGTLLWQQLNLEDGHRHRQDRPLLLASAFDNGLANRKSAFKRLNSNIRATSYPNLVNFRPIIHEFTLLNAQFLPRFARNLTTIFLCHVGVSKWIGRSQFSFQQSNWQSFLYIL